MVRFRVVVRFGLGFGLGLELRVKGSKGEGLKGEGSRARFSKTNNDMTQSLLHTNKQQQTNNNNKQQTINTKSDCKS